MCAVRQGRVSGILATIPVYAVMADDVGQRGAYRVGYQQLLHLLPGFSGHGSAGHVAPQFPHAEVQVQAQAQSAACEKRNKLLLLAGVLTSLFFLGAKSHS